MQQQAELHPDDGSADETRRPEPGRPPGTARRATERPTAKPGPRCQPLIRAHQRKRSRPSPARRSGPSRASAVSSRLKSRGLTGSSQMSTRPRSGPNARVLYQVRRRRSRFFRPFSGLPSTDRKSADSCRKCDRSAGFSQTPGWLEALLRAAADAGQFGPVPVLPRPVSRLRFRYSAFTRGEERERVARISDPVFDHGLAPKFDGYDIWGEARYRLITNSLGFKDAVDARGAAEAERRAASSDRQFLHRSDRPSLRAHVRRTASGATDRRAREKVEFLDAGVASYSPIIYYKKIKYLLDRGLTIRRGRAAVGQFRRRGRGQLLFLHRRRSEISPILHDAAGHMPGARAQARFLHRPFRRHQPRPHHPQALDPVASRQQAARDRARSRPDRLDHAKSRSCEISSARRRRRHRAFA